MDIDAFLESVSADGLRLPATDTATTLQRAPEKVDALFHLPLIALAIMIVARQTPFRTVIMGVTPRDCFRLPRPVFSN
jgi:hypothetical protein